MDRLESPLLGRKVQMVIYSFGFLASFLFFWWPWLFLDDFSQWSWLIPFNTFVALPILDAVLGEYRGNWSDEENK